MNLVGIIDVVGFVAFASGLAFAFRLPAKRYGAVAKLMLCFFLATYLLVEFSNLLEHLGFSAQLDRYEDYLEILVLPFFIFFILSVENWRELQKRQRVEETLRAQTSLLASENKERLFAEEELRKEKERLETVMQGVGAGLVIISPDYKTLWANGVIREIFGDTVDKPCYEAYNQRKEICPGCAARQVFAGVEGKVSCEMEGWDRDGNRVWSEIIATPIYDKDGTVSGVMEVVLPVTEKKKMHEEKEQLEARLRYSQKMEAVGTLAGGIAHDFNNLLYVILGNAEMTSMKVPLESELQQNLAEIIKSCRRAADLVNQILAFSRSAEKARLPLSLAPVVKEALKSLRKTLPATIEVRENIDNQCGQTLADLGQMHQVVVNLCANAAEAMGEKGGILTVTLRNADEGEPLKKAQSGNRYLKLTVADTGVGMDAEVVSRMFEPYFTTKAFGAGDGKGLGLAAVHGIVEAHGGHIEVASAPGRGTAVTVYLPLIAGEGLTESRAGGLEEGRGGAVTAKILAVDDEEAIVRVIEVMLGQSGYEVEAFTDPRLAWEAFVAKPHAYDLVITDQTMPGLSGPELAKNMLMLRPDLPVILSTGHQEEVTRELVEGIRISQFLKKPVSMGNLCDTVAKALAGRRGNFSEAAAIKETV